MEGQVPWYPTRWNNLRPGDYGFDYFDRAAGALEGLFVHDREEAVYFSTYEDGDANLFDGRNAYVLHFDKDEIPPTLKNGFWSITMYGTNFQLVKNPINRFSIGDRTPGLAYNADGSLDILIQATAPPKAARATGCRRRRMGSSASTTSSICPSHRRARPERWSNICLRSERPAEDRPAVR